MPSSKDPTKDAKSRRRPGAPPGNLNALKHGFYSHIFRATELEQLQEFNEQDIAQEIELLRLIIKRTTERAAEVESFDSHLRFLSVLAQAIAQLTRLLKVQKAYRAAQRSEEEDQSLEELYLKMCSDYRRAYTSHRPPGTPRLASARAGAAPPPRTGEAEDQQSAWSQPSLFGDEDSQSQDA